MKFRIESITSVEQNHIDKILSIFRFIKKDYPDFTSWFNSKVVLGLNNGTRNIFFAFAVNNDRCELAGIMILKNDSNEKKICTLCVLDSFRKKGLGTKFIELAQKELQVDKPLITVSASYKADFENIFSKFGFKCFAEYSGYYKRNITEYSYNGFLIDNTMEMCLYA